MKTAIKLYTETSAIRTYQGDMIITEKKLDEIYWALNTWVKFMKIGWKIINTSDIRSVEKYLADDMEMYILSQEDPKKQRLLEILQERKNSNFKTKGIEHLEQIYQDRFTQ